MKSPTVFLHSFLLQNVQTLFILFSFFICLLLQIVYIRKLPMKNLPKREISFCRLIDSISTLCFFANKFTIILLTSARRGSTKIYIFLPQIYHIYMYLYFAHLKGSAISLPSSRNQKIDTSLHVEANSESIIPFPLSTLFIEC